MSEDKGRAAAARILEGLGFSVEIVPESDSKTADLRCMHSGDSYVIECKRKSHDLDREAETAERIKAGELVEHSEAHGGRNSIANRIKEADQQIASIVDSDDQAFRCVWIEVVGVDKDLRWEQVVCTFYGATHAVSLGEDPLAFAFYVDRSAAYHHNQIDSVMLTDGRDFCLLLNEFSPRYDRMKETAFCKQVGPGVLDPRAYLSAGLAVALYGTADRSSDEVVETALTSQEGRQIRLLRMKRHSVTTWNPLVEDHKD